VPDRRPDDPTSRLAELARLDADPDVPQVLARIADLAMATFPTAAEVSVTLVLDGMPSIAAASGPLAASLGDRHSELGMGPAFDAATQQTQLTIADTHDGGGGYPAFAAAAAAAGVRSVVSAGFPVQEQVSGAINVFIDEPGGLEDEDLAVLVAYARFAAVVLANARLVAEISARARQMEEAMLSRAVIEQAKGIIMSRRAVSPEEAFEILSRASQVSNRKLRDIAKSLVDGAAGP
jgi:GAF domain-containing protein